MSQKRTLRFKTILTIATLIALVALAVGLRRQIWDTISNLDRLNLSALVLIVVWQVIGYHSQARIYQSFFSILNQKVRYRSMLRTAIELNFVSLVFPSGGVSGFSYFGLKMGRYGVSPGKATLVQIMRFISLFISFQLLLFLGLIMLSLGGQTSNFTVLVAASLATLLVVLTWGLVFIIGSKNRINAFFTFLTGVVNRLIHVVRPAHPETINIKKAQELFTDLHENYLVLKHDFSKLKRPLIFALVANCCELLTIYTVYIAFGHLVNPGAVIIAYAVANFAGLLSVLPGGIGLYEGLMTAVMASAGVSAAVTLPVIVTYRTINTLVQLPLGGTLYYRTTHKK